MIHLKVLSEEYCRSVFYHFAFLNKEQNRSKFMEEVGNDIVKKCNGFPLVAKTLGSLMHRKKTLREWKDVLNSKIWELKEIEQQVFQLLLLSYYDLTPVIRRLLYCSIFPKDYRIGREDLIELWLSQDYLNVKGNKEKEAIGQMYFEDLVMRSFFRDFEDVADGNITSCKMHDIIHDFVQYLTENECFVEINGSIDGIAQLDDTVRHLTLMFAEKGPFPVSLLNCKTLRILATFDSDITSIGLELILQSKFVRTLNLCHNSIREIPKEIGGLIHLRYLDLSSNYTLGELPGAMCELYNLQTLRLVMCFGLKKLPKAMRKLINLKHLHVKGSRNLKSEGIGGLKCLKTLDEIHVNGGASSGGFNFEDMKNLIQLQGRLSIKHLGLFGRWV